MTQRLVCFIHSTTTAQWRTIILEKLVGYIRTSGLYDRLDNLFINNLGEPIEYKDDKIIVVNYSNDVNLFENCTIRILNFFAKFHPEYKILYLHTKGISYSADHKYTQGISDWIDYMLYNLVHHHDTCTQMLEHVDAVGCQYVNALYTRPTPSHYSGNFWWAKAHYLSTLSVINLKTKHDAEFWLFSNNPTFINIHSEGDAYTRYNNRLQPPQYQSLIDSKITQHLHNLKNIKTLAIYYGTDSKYIDITDICHNLLCINGLLRIPAGDMERNKLFTDPCFGVTKHIRIGEIKYSYKEDICIPYCN